MPAKSKAQYRFMQARCHGATKQKGPSKKVACEFVRGQSSKGLPKRARKRRK